MGSARSSAAEAVLTAVVTQLKATSAVTDLATGGIFNHVEQDTDYPYVEVTSPSDTRQDTFGRFGGTFLVDVKAVSQYRGDKQNTEIIDACITALNNQLLAMTDHDMLGLAWDSTERFRELVNGIVTRHHVATFRVWSEQES